MGTRQRIGGRSSVGLYAGLVAALALIVSLVYVFFVVVPDLQRQREAEVQHIQAAATAEARGAEVQRAYGAGGAFAAAGDWDKAVEEFSRVLALQPDYRDAMVRLTEARNQAAAVKVAVAAQSAATATAQAISDIESAYQRGLGYANLQRWDQAKTELEKVIAIDPNYKDVQTRLVDIETKLAEKIPAPTINPTEPPTPLPVPTRTPAPKVINISAAGEWQDTGVSLAAGQTFEVTATGAWSHGLGDTAIAPNPYGPGGCGKEDSNAIMPSAPIGVLIGRIGDGALFVVGERLESVAGVAGRLRLSMNDAVGTYSDNSDYVTVTIRVK